MMLNKIFYGGTWISVVGLFYNRNAKYIRPFAAQEVCYVCSSIALVFIPSSASYSSIEKILNYSNMRLNFSMLLVCSSFWYKISSFHYLCYDIPLNKEWRINAKEVSVWLFILFQVLLTKYQQQKNVLRSLFSRVGKIRRQVFQASYVKLLNID